MTRLDIEVRLAGADLDGALAVACTVPGVRAESAPRYLWPLLAAAGAPRIGSQQRAAVTGS